MQILLVEDDIQLGSTLSRALELEGYNVEWVKTAEHAEIAVLDNAFEMMILDWMLPKRSGLSLLKQLRIEQCDLPILMLTARVGIEHKISGLDSGADDYLTKPFELDELLARVRALLRRRTVMPDLTLHTSKVSLFPERSELVLDSKVFTLSKNDLIIMRCLIENAGRYISKPRLEELISHWDEPVSANAIEAQISRLRKRLGNNLIHTLRGIGYKVEA